MQLAYIRQLTKRTVRLGRVKPQLALEPDLSPDQFGDLTRVDAVFASLDHEPEKLAQGAARALAQISGCTAAISTPCAEDLCIAHYEVVQVGRSAAAVLAVTTAGYVRTRVAATKKKKAVERSSIDQRIDYRWIDLRTDENQLMFKAQSCFVNAMRKFLLDRNFIEIHTPKLIAAASESGSEVFKVDYFDRNAYLAQSPQFYKQMAMAAGFERIFETGPVFRAEKS